MLLIEDFLPSGQAAPHCGSAKPAFGVITGPQFFRVSSDFTRVFVRNEDCFFVYVSLDD
jgi:hypothetical protein